MKKFLMYVIVLVGVLFIGYTTYYFVRNNETISITLAENESVYINKDESYELPIKWTKPYSSTKLEVKVLNEKIAIYKPETKLFIGVGGGVTTVEIIPSNKQFGPFRFDIHVGDGSLMFPYTIKSEIELAKIGNDEKYTLDSSYILIKDLDLKAYDNWSPIGSKENPFKGTFDGNYKSISNMKITSAENAGLFGVIESSSIVSNLMLNNAVIDGAFDNAGSIAGQSKGIIRLCKINNFTLSNTKDNSNNGGVVGYMSNNSFNNEFVSFGYVDLTSVKVSAKVAGNFGGIAGYMAGSVVVNSKAYVSKYETLDNSLYFGSIAGVMEDAVKSTKYTFSVIKKAMSVVEQISLDNVSTVAGALVGKNIDRNLGGFSNIIKSCYYANIVNLPVVSQSATTLDLTETAQKDVYELKLKATFVDWNFDSIWTTQDDTVLNEIDFHMAEPEALGEYIPGATITSSSDVLRIFEAIRQNPSAGIVYQVSKNSSNDGIIEVDLNGEEWNTIAPLISKPITCSIICDEDVSVIIKNGKISGNNSSFFGYISGVNTKFNNFVFKNITVDSNAKDVAVVATSLLDNSTLDNIKVQNCNVTGGENSNNIAVVVANNNGNILNTKVNTEADSTNTLKLSSMTGVIGIISAYNYNKINNSSVDMFVIDIDSTSIDASVQYGGICGNSSGTILNSQNLGVVLNNDFYGTIYAGGIVAKITNGAKVESCFAKTTMKVPYTNKNSHLGGVVAYSDKGQIKTSFFSGSIEAYYTAGVCEINSGYIDQCYATGEIRGTIISGIVNYNNLSITNCYVTGKITGISSDAVSNGICYTLPKGSSVSHCFVNVSYAEGLGKKNAESNEEFRAEFEKVFGPMFNVYPATGTLTNSIIINYENANVKGTFFDAIKNGWIDCSNDEACGKKGNYEKFKNDAKFDQSIWVFNPEENGGYPYLKNTPIAE